MKSMEKRLYFLSLWAINGPLDLQKLELQLKEMKTYGLDGTIFHPRYYPGRPAYMSREYLDILNELILYAKELGMEFWIYDENGWPSGSADGKILEKYPDSTCEWLEFENGQVVKKQRNAFNTFNKEEMEYFIEYIYDGYREGLSSEAFEWVTGFFSDEVGFLDGHGASMDHGGIPWCDEAGIRYRKQYGEEIREKWQLLFCDGDGSAQVRYRYWQILSDILAEHFYRAIDQWCERYGKCYTAHLKGEETLFFQVPCSGSLYRNLMEVNMPAVDALERYPGNHYYPRVASSVSRQFSNGECMAEILGGSGWGLSPKNVADYVNWLANCGITRFALHLWQYEKNSASIRDWPPDIPMGLNWRNAWKDLVKDLHLRWDEQVGKKNTILLVAPERAVMSGFRPQDSMCLNEHNGAGTPDTESGRISKCFGRLAEYLSEIGVSFDVTNERIMELYGQIENNKLRLGHMVYDTVILGQSVFFEDMTLLRACRDCGMVLDAKQLEWKYVDCPVNQVIIPLRKTDGCNVAKQKTENSSINGTLSAEAAQTDWYGEIQVRQSVDLTGMRIRLQEPAAKLSVCGVDLDVRAGYDGNGIYYYILSDEVEEKIRKDGILKIILSFENKKEESPFLFVEGFFLVKCKSGYEEKDERQCICEGDFYLTGSVKKILLQGEMNFVASGFPFCGSCVTVHSQQVAGENGLTVGTDSTIHADAARVWVDGSDAGFVWGPDWNLPSVTQGIHNVELDLYPSTFNTFGPHHHYQGDRALTSPLQYSGVKAFADDDDAPLYTLISQWHFVKFGITGIGCIDSDDCYRTMI